MYVLRKKKLKGKRNNPTTFSLQFLVPESEENVENVPVHRLRKRKIKNKTKYRTSDI
jgi:hypothetical protein